MLDEKELKKTKRVNITGEIPNGRLQILDNNGKIKEFRLREMTIAGARTEIDQCNRENYCVYYKGASCIIKMWMLKIENTSEYNKTTDWQVSKNLIIQRGIYNEV